MSVSNTIFFLLNYSTENSNTSLMIVIKPKLVALQSNKIIHVFVVLI